MSGIPQLGIAFGALGIVLALLGLFPDVTGIPTGQGFGVVQFVAVMIGFALLIFGGLIYVKYTFFQKQVANLAQQIGIRLALTGLVLSGITGFADFLGFGSHVPSLTQDVVLGPVQAIGIIGGFMMSSIGIFIYAITGKPDSIAR
jgi:hypothetical protein